MVHRSPQPGGGRGEVAGDEIHLARDGDQFGPAGGVHGGQGMTIGVEHVGPQGGEGGDGMSAVGFGGEPRQHGSGGAFRVGQSLFPAAAGGGDERWSVSACRACWARVV